MGLLRLGIPTIVSSITILPLLRVVAGHRYRSSVRDLHLTSVMVPGERMIYICASGSRSLCKRYAACNAR
ncbi:hypothetical protein BD310DRAFT_922140 [Dichomitus squalens]|uniref:Uncharacterized protein n=1 Tax=Dichomitus squalens TaxID=114155 RepID=A0A4Q9Q0Z6_9APHY|nr:hypothetical protein BD310DRAFT_922140 [Dichomitus squalens]